MLDKNRETTILGCILGTAVGDALGLPCENIPPARQKKLFPSLDKPEFFFGHGMVSDDTEHTFITAQALICSAGDKENFTRSMARQLKAWLLMLPGGAGLATLKACLKLLCGVPYTRSGVYSAGNGPAMRSALLGVCYGEDLAKLRSLVRVSARITHTDPKAEIGAFAVALAAHFAAKKRFGFDEYLLELEAALGDEGAELLQLIRTAREMTQDDIAAATAQSAIPLAKGVSGYIYHTVSMALTVWSRHPTDYRTAIEEMIRYGGDTDSTAAIVGGLVGAAVGEAGIPNEWSSALWEWPRGVNWMRSLSTRLAEVCDDNVRRKPLTAAPLLIWLRNICFLIVVLTHGLRRLFPPY